MSQQIDIFVGGRIRWRRFMLGVSKGFLAESIGLDTKQIEEIEAGALPIGAARLYKIATVLDVSVQFFFSNEDCLEELTNGLMRKPLYLH